MHIDKFDFELPPSLIARKKVSNSRMLVTSLHNLKHDFTKNLAEYLSLGDVVILNNTRVIQARLYVYIRNSNQISSHLSTDRKIEIFIYDLDHENVNDSKNIGILARPAKYLSPGQILYIPEIGDLFQVTHKNKNNILVELISSQFSLFELMEQYGNMPIPPYISKSRTEFDKHSSNVAYNDQDEYQTIYAKKDGAVAAPTAGLHITEKILQELHDKGVQVVYITLHVGIGTFLPIKVNNINEHEMHAEYIEISEETASIINNARDNGKNILAVGSTSIRTIEAVASKNDKNNGRLKAYSGYTNIFIQPGYKFHIVNMMLTNFHLPKSSLIVLVSAFLNRETILEAYSEAIDKEYKFYSYGDAMLLTR